MMLFIGVLWLETVLQTRFLPRDGMELPLEGHLTRASGSMLEAYEAAQLAGQSVQLFSFCGNDRELMRLMSSSAVCAQLRMFTVNRPPLQRFILQSSLGEESILQDSLYEVSMPREDANELLRQESHVLLDGESLLCMKGLLTCLQEHPPKALHIAPGASLRKIRPELMASLLALHPVFHVTEDVLCAFTRTGDVAAAAAMVCNLSQSAVIVRMQSGDAWLHTEQGGQLIPASKQASASEYHRAGIVLSRLEQGFSLEDAVRASVAGTETLKRQNAQLHCAKEEQE